MRDMIWIYAAIILLVSEVWSLEPDCNQCTSLNSSTSAPPVRIHAIKYSTFNLGSDANLICSNKTWEETIYVIWEIKLKHKICKIAFSADGMSTDNCSDAKSLQNTSTAQSYLHIPNFSTSDVGVYKCEFVYNGGKENHVINVSVTVPPSISAWLKRRDNKMVAVCKAERGKPAASIKWSHTGISQSNETLLVSEGFITVESRLELAEGMITENLTCAVSHPSWEKERILVPKPKEGYFPWLVILIVVVVSVFFVGLFFAKKKIISRRFQKSDTSPSKSSPTEDVEEVEPYASYVQRVNSIYN